MASLPTRIKVGYRDYRVEEWPAHEADSDGKCDTRNGVIRIRADLERQLAAEILWHEATHAAWDMAGLESGATEEAAVTALSRQTMQIWRDNPDLIAFIDGALNARA